MKLPDPGRRALLSTRGCATRATAAALCSLAALAASGCYTDTQGLDPPLDQLYFPTNLVVSPGGKTLYVTNSDFDLQYNGGTVFALDLEGLRAAAQSLQGGLDQGLGASACDDAPLGPANQTLAVNAQSVLNPGPCSPLDLKPFVKSAASIGAFASVAALVSDAATQKSRLFVTVRGDPSVTYFDVAYDSDAQAPAVPPAGCSSSNPAFCLQCGQDAETKRCGVDHRVGEDATDSIRGLTIPVEPVGLAASEDGTALVALHQTEQTASLVANYWVNPSELAPAGVTAQDTRSAEPYFEYYLGGLPFGPTEVVALPRPRFLSLWDAKPGEEPSPPPPFEDKPLYEQGFMVTHRAASELTLLRYHSDEGSSPRRPFLSRGGTVRVSATTAGDDSRGIALDSSERKACEAACGAADYTCLLNCATAVPLRFYVGNRAPPTLLVGEIRTILAEEGEGGNLKVTGAFEEGEITDVVPLTFGASRVAVGHVIDKEGQRRVRVFAITFDSRLIFVYDPEAARIETVIHTGRGPHGVAFDTGGEGEGAFSFLYVGHFTDSYIGVVDLDMRRPQTFGSMFMTVGYPVPPRESK